MGFKLILNVATSTAMSTKISQCICDACNCSFDKNLLLPEFSGCFPELEQCLAEWCSHQHPWWKKETQISYF